MKGRKWYLLLSACLLLLPGCSQEKNEQVVWYVPQGESWLTEKEDGTAESERIDAFNRRVQELGIDAELVVRTYDPLEYATNTETQKLLQELKEQNGQIDVIRFDEAYLSELEALDPYMETEKGKELAAQLSDTYLSLLKVHDKLYQFPKMVLPLDEQQVRIKEAFYETYKNDMQTSSMKDFLQSLSESYDPREEELLLSGLQCANVISADYANIDESIFYVRRSDGAVVNAYEEKEIREIMELLLDMRDKNYGGDFLSDQEYEKILEKDAIMVKIAEAPVSQTKQEGERLLTFGKPYYVPGYGYSILKDSEHKDAAFALLWAMNTDEEAASILQFGVNPKRDAEGRIVDSEHTPWGSWNSLGNNMIIESAQQEPKHKKEYFRKLENESKAAARHPLTFDLSELAEDMDRLYAIVEEAGVENPSGQIISSSATRKEIEQVLEQTAERLKEAGAEEVRQKLQMQVDEWNAAKE